MSRKKETPANFPFVRGGFGMDLNRQDLCQATGLADSERALPISPISQGDWCNNWVPDEDFLEENEAKKKSSPER